MAEVVAPSVPPGVASSPSDAAAAVTGGDGSSFDSGMNSGGALQVQEQQQSLHQVDNHDENVDDMIEEEVLGYDEDDEDGQIREMDGENDDQNDPANDDLLEQIDHQNSESNDLSIYAQRLKVRVWAAVRKVAGSGGKAVADDKNDDDQLDNGNEKEGGGPNSKLPRHDPTGDIPIIYGGLITRISVSQSMYARIDLVDETGETDVYEGGPTKATSRRLAVRLAAYQCHSESHFYRSRGRARG